jgi:hypothetical protein
MDDADLTRPVGCARTMVLVGLVAVLLTGCGKPADPFNPGANVNADPHAVFAKLMQLPDIDQAAQQYQRMGTEIRQALSAGIPELAPWIVDGDILNAACGNDQPGLQADGQTRHLPDYIVAGPLPDADTKYEQALSIIGATAQKYGFTPTPQRLHDAPGSHDAAFHNVHDDGTIRFGTDKNTLVGLSIGCHLTAEAKKRGTPASTATP